MKADELQKRLDEIVELCQRFNTPAVNAGAHALANRVIQLATGTKNEHK